MISCSEAAQSVDETIFVSCSYCNDQAEYVFPDGSDPSVCCSSQKVEGMVTKVQRWAVLDDKESEPKKGPVINISENKLHGEKMTNASSNISDNKRKPELQSGEKRRGRKKKGEAVKGSGSREIQRNLGCPPSLWPVLNEIEGSDSGRFRETWA